MIRLLPSDRLKIFAATTEPPMSAAGNSRLQAPRNEENWVRITDGRLIYILIAKRDEFDEIALPVIDHGENDNGHVLSKTLDKDGVYIVFQHWLKERTIEAIRADNDKRRAAEAEKAACA